MFNETVSDLSKAYKYMVSKHGLQKRKDGEDYIEHPKRTAMNVFMFKAGSYQIESLMIIGLLHDVIEDTNGTYEDIKEEFGELVADTVKELTSISREVMEKQGEAKNNK